jgi:peptidyl-prolyl cis-trans isomerase A (cyclophilin A)
MNRKSTNALVWGALVALCMGSVACDPKKDDAPKEGASADAPKEGEAGASATPDAPDTKAEPAAPAGEVKPEDASKATSAPVAADLAAFTADLGTGTLRATLVTSMGELNCELFEKESPITVANFVGLARGLKAWTMPIVDPTSRPPVKPGEVKLNTPLYKDVLCHRVIPGFMIQCGDPSGTGMGNPGYQIPDEFGAGLKHDKPGLLSMANAGPGTGGSQFFVTEVPTPHLDNRHTVFGSCDNVELIKEIARVDRAAQDRPVTDVVIKQVSIYRGEKK